MGWPNSGSHVVHLLLFLFVLLSSNLDLIQKLNVGRGVARMSDSRIFLNAAISWAAENQVSLNGPGAGSRGPGRERLSAARRSSHGLT